MKKHTHWTQTPKGKRLLAERAAKKEIHNGKDFDSHIAYCFGRTEAFIEYYADGAGVPREALAIGVASLLRRKAMR